MKTLLKYLALAAAIAGLTGQAQAVPQLKIFDGVTTIVVTDQVFGPGGDFSVAPGQVTFIGSIGNWTLNVHTGTSYPAIGSLANPQLDLSFNATSNAAGGTLRIYFSANGFGPTNGTTFASIGGTNSTSSSVTYKTYGGTNNTNFSLVNLLTSQGPFSGAAYSSTTTGGSVNSAGPYSLTQLVTIVHASGATRISTGDAFLTVPDSGTSILMLGAGLTSMGLLARFRRRVVV